MVPTEELEEYPRRSRVAKYAVIAALVVIGAVALVYVLQPADDSEGPQKLPAFELPLLEGDGTLSSDDLEGSPVVLNFFASWCIPCIEEAPLLERAWKEHGDAGVEFVGVNIEDTEDRALDFVREHGITFPVVKDYDKELFGDLGLIQGLPQTVFVTSEGELLAVTAGDAAGGGQGGTTTLGAIDGAVLEERIQALLGGDDEGP
jgi:cytochrome c biogenesis protein CcmG/thiol:disulfide interchange protein DsbE